MKKICAKFATEIKLSKWWRFLNRILKKVFQIKKSTHSMEKVIIIQIYQQVMFSWLLNNKNMHFLKERGLIYSSRKEYLFKKLLLVLILLSIFLMETHLELQLQKIWLSSQICPWQLRIKVYHSSIKITSTVISSSCFKLTSQKLSTKSKLNPLRNSLPTRKE